MIDRAGYPFIFAPLVIAVLLFFTDSSALAGFSLTLSLICLAFFRDPNRVLPTGVSPDAVISPADGKVLYAGPAQIEACPPGQWGQVSIFLSPLDVHVNRVPVNGRVTDVTYQAGKFFPAYDARSAVDNERSEVTVNHEGQVVIFRQIVGLLARRVVCRIKPGMTIVQGQRFGVMKFGSRMDVFVPTTAAILVETGERVRSGETVIAVLSGARKEPALKDQ